PRPGIDRPPHEVGVLSDVAEGLIETPEGLEGNAPDEEVAERDIVRGSDRAGARVPLVRRDPASDPGRREEQIRKTLGVRGAARPEVGTAYDLRRSAGAAASYKL